MSSNEKVTDVRQKTNFYLRSHCLLQIKLQSNLNQFKYHDITIRICTAVHLGKTVEKQMPDSGRVGSCISAEILVLAVK